MPRRKSSQRQKIGKFYVTRRKDGTFKKWVGVGRSLAADKRRKSSKKVKSGQGHRGDLKTGLFG